MSISKKTNTRITLILSTLALFAATPFGLILTGLDPPLRSYEYTSDNGAFYFNYSQKNYADFFVVKSAFEEYKSANNKPELKLYRAFRKSPFKYYRYLEYLKNKKWQYPYKYCKKCNQNNKSNQLETVCDILIFSLLSITVIFYRKFW